VKNITVSLDDGLYHAARVAAAQHRTSVSALVRGYLSALVDGKAAGLPGGEEREERRKREELVRLFREANLVLGYKPGRQRTYER
jgi:plasmid stability protein